MAPLLGFIRKRDRTAVQHSAAAFAENRMIARHGLPVPTLAKGERILLTDAFKHSTVVKEVGLTFDRVHQLTGSCVWAGGTNALMVSIAVQRITVAAPTMAFLPFTLGNYAMSRHDMGDDSEGEGSMGSTFAKSLTEDGVRDWVSGASLPAFTQTDGISCTSRDEMTWSSFRNPALAAVITASKPHLLGAAGLIKTSQDIKAFIANGFGCSFACNDYVGHGTVQGTGDRARVIGKYDGNGGHQQWVGGYEENPDFGPLYLWGNNWPGSTYPILPSQPVCSVWMKEADVDDALQRLDPEAYGLSHVSWFPANPNVLSTFI